MKNYIPIFKTEVADISEKWNLIRTFIEGWYNFKIPVTDFREQLSYLEKELNIELPKAVAEYYTLANQLAEIVYTYPNGNIKSDRFLGIFRDCFEISFLEQHNAYTLMKQAEGDIYWAVKKEDIFKEDATVYCYLLDYDDDSNNKFDLFGMSHQSVTAFALNHIFSYLSNCSSFGMPVENMEALRIILEKNLENHVYFDGLEFYEDNNIIAYFAEDMFEENSYTFCFYLRENREVATVPKPILELVQYSGWTSNRFNNFIL